MPWLATRRGGEPRAASTGQASQVVSQGAIVENERLGAVLTVIQSAQTERDRVRLPMHGLTMREKDRILSDFSETQQLPNVPSLGPSGRSAGVASGSGVQAVTAA